MEAAEFDYDLPKASIAQQPAEPRDRSRLLIAGQPPEHRLTTELPDLVGPGDVIVLNDSRVMNARLRLHKPTGGRVEVLALEPQEDGWWEALIRPSRRVGADTDLIGPDGSAVLSVGPATASGTRLVRPLRGDMAELMQELGSVPLPPYIATDLADIERYQTVYSDNPASVAAPTAGLHLTEEVIERCRDRGAAITTVELRVGIGTFRPIETTTLEEHQMHSEYYRIPSHTWDLCIGADRVVAVGTTVVRALESASATGNLFGRTDLFIRPGFEFHVVDALLTNFHMPRSSLLVMVEAFMGPRWREIYAEALELGYRFLSFGDAMFVERLDQRRR